MRLRGRSRTASIVVYARLACLALAGILFLSAVVVPLAPHRPSGFDLFAASPGASAGSQAAPANASRQGEHWSAGRRKDSRDGAARQDEKTRASSPWDQKKSGRAGQCGGGLERIPGSEFCTHGPDPAPPGLDVARRIQPLPAKTARAALTPVCDGDGQSGYRVQVLYVRAEGSPDRFNQYVPSLRAWAAGADGIMEASAAETGGSRRFRFVTDASCQIDVQPVALPTADVASFGPTITALRSRGFSRADRYYLVFVDSTTSGYCGIGTFWSDDSSAGNNRNNAGPGYSRVDAGCWGAGVAAHELMHNLGGVQRSAPNSTAGGHCVDEWDLMCYKDASTATMQTICPDSARNAVFDCQHDDYFHTNPPPGSYLATHWNTANNRFLIGEPAIPGSDQSPPLVTITSPRNGANPKGKKTMILSVTASDAGSGLASVEFRRCGGGACAWDQGIPLAGSGPPFTARWKLPKRGTFTLLAQAIDDDGNVALSSPVTIRVKKG